MGELQRLTGLSRWPGLTASQSGRSAVKPADRSISSTPRALLAGAMSRRRARPRKGPQRVSQEAMQPIVRRPVDRSHSNGVSDSTRSSLDRSGVRPHAETGRHRTTHTEPQGSPAGGSVRGARAPMPGRRVRRAPAGRGRQTLEPRRRSCSSRRRSSGCWRWRSWRPRSAGTPSA